MTDRGWKQFERRLALALGNERIPVTGERDGADFEDALFCYQAKKQRTFPGYVADWLDRVRAKVHLRRSASSSCNARAAGMLRPWSCSRSPIGSSSTSGGAIRWASIRRGCSLTKPPSTQAASGRLLTW